MRRSLTQRSYNHSPPLGHDHDLASVPRCQRLAVWHRD